MKKESKIRQVSKTKWFILLMIVVLCFFVFATGREFWRRLKLEMEIGKIEDEISALEQQNSELSELIDYFNSSLWQETELRQRLGLQKEGETMVVIPEEKTIQPQKLALNPEPSIPGPMKWWNYFFKK